VGCVSILFSWRMHTNDDNAPNNHEIFSPSTLRFSGA
jgi:hypothetical protein